MTLHSPELIIITEMQKLLLLLLAALLISGIAYAHKKEGSIMLKNNLIIQSPAYQNNSVLPIKYTADGDSINPPLIFKNVPKNAKSLVLILEDPDAPRGIFVHWIAYNLSPETKGISEGTMPAEASFGKNTIGGTEYVSPSPPPGKPHHYIFKLYALDTKLPDDKSLDRKELLKLMNGHILAQASLTGIYGR